MFQIMNCELSHNYDWFGSNKLSLNVSESSYILPYSGND